jgi:hypothetical protein
MKKAHANKLMLFLVGLVLLVLVGSSAQAYTSTVYQETFGGVAGNPVASPTGIGYVYADSGFTAAGIDKNILSGQSVFYVNSSTTAAVANGWANFTFNTSYAYQYFGFSFYYKNTYLLKQNHSGMEFRLRGDNGDILFLRVFGANDSIAGKRNRLVLLDYNGVEHINISITKDKWYDVMFAPDYDAWDNHIKVYVYDRTAASYVVNAEELSLNGNAALTKFYMHNTPNSAKTCIIVDGLYMMKTVYTQSDITTNYLAQYVIPIVFAVVMLGVLGMMILTDNLTPQLLIAVMIAAIIGIITLMIITSL